MPRRTPAQPDDEKAKQAGAEEAKTSVTEQSGPETTPVEGAGAVSGGEEPLQAPSAEAAEVPANSATEESDESDEPTEEDIAEAKVARENFGTREEVEAKIAALPDGPRKRKAIKIFEAVFADEEPVVKSGGRKVSVRGFFGAYAGSVFVEDKNGVYGVAENVSDDTLNLLRKEFPNAEIVEG